MGVLQDVNLESEATPNLLIEMSRMLYCATIKVSIQGIQVFSFSSHLTDIGAWSCSYWTYHHAMGVEYVCAPALPRRSNMGSGDKDVSERGSAV